MYINMYLCEVPLEESSLEEEIYSLEANPDCCGSRRRREHIQVLHVFGYIYVNGGGGARCTRMVLLKRLFVHKSSEQEA